MLMLGIALCAVLLIFFQSVNRNVVLLLFLTLMAMVSLLGFPRVFRGSFKIGVTPIGKYRQVKRSEEPVQFWLHLLVFGAIWLASFMWIMFMLISGVRQFVLHSV
jgi:hypothetical protein